tara:strand:- start:252 stop:437 length:186 start_codon:yes stop_codon:yes gene_type:complete
MDYDNITVKYYREDDGSNSTKALKVIYNETVYSVPTDMANKDYIEIKNRIDAGTLTIEEAD